MFKINILIRNYAVFFIYNTYDHNPTNSISCHLKLIPVQEITHFYFNPNISPN